MELSFTPTPALHAALQEARAAADLPGADRDALDAYLESQDGSTPGDATAVSSSSSSSSSSALTSLTAAPVPAAPVPLSVLVALRRHLRKRRQASTGRTTSSSNTGSTVDGQTEPDASPRYVHQLMGGSTLQFPAEEGEEESAYMKQRREYLLLKQKRYEYEELTKSVNPDRHGGGSGGGGGGNKGMVQSAGVALNLIVAMGGAFVVLYLLARQASVPGSPQPMLAGVFGAVFMLGVEVTLYMIRDRREDEWRRRRALRKDRAVLGKPVNAPVNAALHLMKQAAGINSRAYMQ